MWKVPSLHLEWSLIKTALAVVMLAGCTTAPPVAPTPEPRPLGSDLGAYRAPRIGAENFEGAELPASVEPKGTLMLGEALALALERNPDLAAFSWEVRAREARALQAGLLPNPELDVEVENFAGTGEARSFDAAETTFSLGQLIETAGKRLKRRRAAELNAEVAGWEYELARVELFARVVQGFVDVLAAQERLALAEELVRVAEESAQATARLVRAGAASPVEGTRAAVAVATREVELETTRRELEGARARLAATWGARSARFAHAEGELGAVEAPPPLEALQAQLEQNPLLERWSREIARREAVVDLERARRMPNLTLAGGLRRLSETDDSALVVGMTVPLPVFDRNQGARAAARSDLRKAHHQRRAAEVRVYTALETAYQELLARFREATDLGEEILPKAQEAFEGVRSGYLRGLFRNVDVLQAQETLFELRLRELDALRGYGNAVAEIERLTGAPLHGGP